MRHSYSQLSDPASWCLTLASHVHTFFGINQLNTIQDILRSREFKIALHFIAHCCGISYLSQTPDPAIELRRTGDDRRQELQNAKSLSRTPLNSQNSRQNTNIKSNSPVRPRNFKFP